MCVSECVGDRVCMHVCQWVYDMVCAHVGVHVHVCVDCVCVCMSLCMCIHCVSASLRRNDCGGYVYGGEGLYLSARYMGQFALP